MYVIEPKIPVGCRILFLYNSYAMTGIVKSIGTDSYGIICDSDHFTTDKLMIPRQGNEIFVPIKNCIKDGEIVPIRYENEKVNGNYRFAHVIDAKELLPKKTIYPCLYSGISESMIQFIPGIHIFKLENKEMYLYDFSVEEVSTLRNLEDFTKKKVPNWKYQKNVIHNPKITDGITEDDIDEVYEIPKNYRNQITYSEIGIKGLIDKRRYDVVFSKTDTDRKLIHFSNIKNDTIEEELPDEIIYDKNLFLKRDNQN